MFKIRSPQNNDTRTVIAAVLVAVILGLAATNLSVMVPGLVKMFSPLPKASQPGLIDTQSVQGALDVVGNSVH